MKQEIKDWLRQTKRDRHWLADQVGVGKRTVDNWLSSPKEIPTSCQRLIRNLIDADAELLAQQQAEQEVKQNLVLEIDEATFDAYNAAALSRRMLIKQWAISELDRAAAEAKQVSYLAAEPQPPEYGAGNGPPAGNPPPTAGHGATGPDAKAG